MDKFTRLLSMVALLEQREYPQTFEAIKEQLGPQAYPQSNPESARRSFERDKDDLLAMGVPLRTEPFYDDPSNTGYTIRRERTRVADPGFTPAELAALRMAATATALRHDGVNELADATDGLLKYGGMAPHADSPSEGNSEPEQLAEIRLDSNITEIFAAITDRASVAFSYNERTRRVLPLHLAWISGNWYLRGQDLDEAEQRTFRLDRIDGPVIAPGEDAELGAQVTGGTGTDTTELGRFRPWEFGAGDTEEVLVAFDPPAAAVALAQHPGLRVSEDRPDQRVVEFSVRNPEGLWSWLLQFVDRAVVLDPTDMRNRYVDYVSALAVEGESG